MGIPSLNSAILYNISLYFPFTDPSLALRMTPKSCKYPEPRPQKLPFSWTGGSICCSHPENEHFHGWEMKFGIGTFMHHVLFNE